MTKREKIIVSLMVASIFYGAYELLLAGGDQPEIVHKADGPAQLQQFVGDVATSLAKVKPSASLGAVIKAAETPWAQDPFLQQVINMTAQRARTADQDARDAMNHHYTGFLQMGDRRLAIVDGIEFEIGEEIDARGHLLKRILPTYIEIGRPGTEENFTLPLEEADSAGSNAAVEERTDGTAR